MSLSPGHNSLRSPDFERFSKGLMGYANFCYKLYDDPGLVAKIFCVVGELWLNMFTRAAAHPQVRALWLADDIAFGSGLLFSEEIMRRHLFPWYKRIGAACASHGKPFLFHSDGDLRPVIDDLIACGVSALHPIEPAAMSIDELKAQYKGRLCLVGNIDLSSTLTMGTPAEVREEVRARIESVGPGGGYCVGSSNSVTNYVPLENFTAMLDATFEYGAYPVT